VVRNTGHTIEATMPASSKLTLTVGSDVYRLVRFEFHAPSEHTVDGTGYPVELHLVHESPGGEAAVVAIFLEPSSLPSPLIDEVIESAGGVGEEVPISDVFAPLSLVEWSSSSSHRGRPSTATGPTRDPSHARLYGGRALVRAARHPHHQ
jgi:carbonic anhydrase